ncbi:MAG: hypothetical protein IJ720_01055 [Clostridia bacterium]|nr:hypothetical protein [Clostridia bacterium]MBR1703935.1 hypothetical protein [Clostridia bacterium]
MDNANKINFTDAVLAARKGDEDAYEFLYNQSVQKVRALSMKYFDPSTKAGRRKTDDVVREVFLRGYDRIKTLSDPEDYPLLGKSITRDVCLQKAKNETVQLETESYIGTGAEPTEESVEPPLVSAKECREEVRGENMMSSETIGTLVLAVLHRLTPSQRLALVRWNENDAAAMKLPEVLRGAFIAVEKAVMDLEGEYDIRARDFAKSRLAFFNWLLDLYNRHYEASTKDWNGALEPGYARQLSGSVPEEEEEEPAAPTFGTVWEEIRAQFYLQNTAELPDLADFEYNAYLDGEEEETGESPAPSAPNKRRGFLGSWWGRLLLGLLIIVVVLASVVATAGQHTSHALSASVQIADLAVEQVCGFNIS